ncbi:hypothetical protein D3C77_672040 [compost metagenome]
MHMPRGGMALKPLVTLATSASIPLARRGSQAALSPLSGAMGSAPLWQAAQARLNTASGSWAACAEAAAATSDTTSISFFMVDLIYIRGKRPGILLARSVRLDIITWE